jgi:hypothetical protein
VSTEHDSSADDSKLLAALRQALTEPGEQRLCKSVRHPAQFDERGPEAERALADGLLDIVRTEARGGHTTEWVKLTPAGVRLLHAHDSPRAVLAELRDALRTSREGVPALLDNLHGQLHDAIQRMTGDVARLVHRLDTLSARVEDALQKLAAPAAPPLNGVAQAVPWAADALRYLDQRSEAGAGDCPMPELFAALRDERPQLTLGEFHAGLRRLAEVHSVQLKPFTDSPKQLNQPEYALLDGASVLYFVSRGKN